MEMTLVPALSQDPLHPAQRSRVPQSFAYCLRRGRKILVPRRLWRGPMQTPEPSHSPSRPRHLAPRCWTSTGSPRSLRGLAVCAVAVELRLLTRCLLAQSRREKPAADSVGGHERRHSSLDRFASFPGGVARTPDYANRSQQRGIPPISICRVEAADRSAIRFLQEGEG